MIEHEPRLIESRLSRQVTWDGYRLQVAIYRLDDRPGWTLEVVNEEGTSTLWDDAFLTDRDAEAAFRDTLALEGIAAFLDESDIVPFTGRMH